MTDPRARSDPPAGKRPFWAKCGACGHCWVAAYLPMEMAKAASLLGRARCPMGCDPPVFIARQHDGELQEPAA